MYCVGVMVVLLANISLIPPILSDRSMTLHVTFHLCHISLTVKELFALWALSVKHGPIHSFTEISYSI